MNLKNIFVRALPAMVIGGLCAAVLSCTPAKAPSVDSVARVLCDAVPVLISSGVKVPDEVLEYVTAVCHLTAEEAQALKAPEADAGAE